MQLSIAFLLHFCYNKYDRKQLVEVYGERNSAMKQCKQCKAYRSLEDFHIDRNRRRAVCRLCRRQYREALAARGNRNAQSAKLMFICTSCKVEKPRSEFHADKSHSTGIRSQCKTCAKTRPNAYSRHYMLQADYGLTLPEYEVMLNKQGGVCAICKKPETVEIAGRMRSLAVDHDHHTSKVRGLLCSRCNLGIGRFDDDADLLDEAARYIRAASLAK